jgi:formylglycine-generating enzyme required for sulfatase activity
MVYVPTGNFAVGSGGSEANSFTAANDNTAPYTTFQIGAAAPTLQGNGGTSNAANLSASGDFDLTGTNTATLATGFPTGYNAFYCMKYEISQGQYRDFLNTLTYQQQVTRTSEAPTSAAGTGALSNTNANRNGIDIQTPANATTQVPAVYACNLDGDAVYNEAVDGEWIACGFLSWMDGCAYMDWAGLRPMTELEFEKVCRGGVAAVANEYAWATAAIPNAAYTLNNAGANNETINANYGATNASYGDTDGAIDGPLRTGIFAGVGTTRLQSGASFFGAMEMSGNLWERAVTVGNAAGRSFTGVHGNGTLLADGTANVDFWPGINGNNNPAAANTAFGNTTGITEAAGSGYRAGSWFSGANDLRVSDRDSAADTTSSRGGNVGFRGVRTAP